MEVYYDLIRLEWFELVRPNHFIMARTKMSLSYLQWMCVVVTLSRLTLCDPWAVASQAPLSLVFSRQDDCSWLPFPSPGEFPSPGTEARTPALQADFPPSEPPGPGLLALQSNGLSSYTEGSQRRGWTTVVAASQG